MLVIVSVICLASSIYYYNTNKRFNYFVKNQKQSIINKCKKINTHIIECFDEDLNNSLGEYMNQENLRDIWVNGITQNSKKQTNIQNLETIIEINEDSDTSENVSSSDNDESEENYEDDEFYMVHKSDRTNELGEETYSNKSSNFWPFY